MIDARAEGALEPAEHVSEPEGSTSVSMKDFVVQSFENTAKPVFKSF